jgi:hypothetical protein
MGPYGAPVPSGSVSVPGVAPPSIPAHFMQPQAPYSDVRMDPPGTSVTSRTRVNGRPAMSWAAALLAFGIFVGVGTVAVMQGGVDSLADTTASFVDPSRTPGARPPAPVPVTPDTAVAPPVAAPVAPPPATVAPVVNPPVAPTTPPGVIGVSTPAPAPQPPVAVTAPPETKPEAKSEKSEKPETKKPVVRYTYRAPVAPPPQKEEAPVAEPKEPKTASKPTTTKKGGKGEDEEMKKALEQLQKSQLESTF